MTNYFGVGSEYVLTHSLCEQCVWSENGFYNPICVHCPYATFSKSNETKFMTRSMAESLGLVKEVKEDE